MSIYGTFYNDTEKIKSFRRASENHTVILDPDTAFQNKCKLMHCAKLISLATDELINAFRKRAEQLFRTKKFRGLKKTRDKCLEANEKDQLLDINATIDEMLDEFGITWEICKSLMFKISKKYNVDNPIAASHAEDTWINILKYISSDDITGKFTQEGVPLSIISNTIDEGIVLFPSGKDLNFRFQNMTGSFRSANPIYQKEIELIIKYLSSPSTIETKAVDEFFRSGNVMNTYRPCKTKFICRHENNRPYIEVYLLIEGRPLDNKR